MALTKAQQAVVDYLVVEPESGADPVSTTPACRGWVSRVGRGGGPSADPTTVRFRKSRAFEGCELHSVAFSTRDGRPMTSITRTLVHENGGTTVAPIGGGGGGAPRRDHPWVNFAAQWDSSAFRGGGEVIGEGAEQARLVRLKFANGTIAEDNVGGGVVLFEVRGPIALPIQVDVLDGGDALIHSYTEFEGFE
jgi:hypothetical protein